MRKIYAIILAGMLMVSIAGCGQNNSNTGGNQNPQNTISSATKTSQQSAPAAASNSNEPKQTTQSQQNSKIDEVSNQFNNLDFDGSLNSNDKVTDKDVNIPNP